VDDLGDLGVVGNLGVEGFAGDGVDVCDELMLDGRAHHLRADYTSATCDDYLHACGLVVCTDMMNSRMYVACRVRTTGGASSRMRGPLGGGCDQLPSVTISITTTSSTSSATPSSITQTDLLIPSIIRILNVHR
jgi:hypothetical protein